MKKTVLILYILLMAAIVLAADRGVLPLTAFASIPRYDWVAHLLIYALFYGLLLNGGVNRHGAFIVSLAVPAIEELSQIFIEYRTFSLMDLIMGFLGVFICRICLKKRTATKF